MTGRNSERDRMESGSSEVAGDAPERDAPDSDSDGHSESDGPTNASRPDDEGQSVETLVTDNSRIQETAMEVSSQQTSIHSDPESSEPLNSNQNGIEEEAGSESIDFSIDFLIERYSSFLFGYAYRLAGNATDAEDLTQQTFLIAHQKLHQLRSKESAKSWLCAVLRSCWLKTIRRNLPTPASNYELELEEVLETELQEEAIDEQAVQKTIDELPEDYRLVLLMYYFEDLSYQEIAEKLQVKIGTVMSRLSRAKDRLRRKLGSKNKLI